MIIFGDQNDGHFKLIISLYDSNKGSYFFMWVPASLNEKLRDDSFSEISNFMLPKVYM